MNVPYEGGEQASAAEPALQPGVEEQPAADAAQPETQAPARSAPKAEPAHGPQGLQFIISVLVIVVFMITFVVQAFRVPSESMENTLLIGDFLLADKMHYANSGGLWQWLLPYRPIRRGDVVVFRYPVDPSQYFVKRVIGLPGDHIRLQNKMVFVNGLQLQESYVIHTMPNLNMYRDDFPLHAGMPADVDRRWRRELDRHVDHGELVVPPGEYFVMGDNRDQSLDSRYWGFVPRGNIMGRPLVIYLSINDGTQAATRAAGSDGKLIKTGQVLAHFLQMARWDRIFHRVL
ncbi:MAG: signal peptidase I [Actinomycetota bacterium]